MLKETAVMVSSLANTEKNLTEEFRITLPQINQTSQMLFNPKSLKTGNFDTIKVSSKIGSNLMHTFDELELMPEFDEMSKKYKGKAENVLKQKKKPEDDKQDNLDEMNNFALNIIKNKTWGSQPNKESRMRYTEHKPIKPSLKDVEKEIGNHHKIPRLRK